MTTNEKSKGGVWVTDGKRVGLVIGEKVLWVGGGEDALSDVFRPALNGEVDRVLDAASRPNPTDEPEV